jgi:hypothetical protein
LEGCSLLPLLPWLQSADLHALKLGDKPCLFQFCQKSKLIKITFGEWFSVIKWSFTVREGINHHICRTWGSENTKAIREIDRESAKVNVWCALSCLEVLGPFFFAE